MSPRIHPGMSEGDDNVQQSFPFFSQSVTLDYDAGSIDFTGIINPCLSPDVP